MFDVIIIGSGVAGSLCAYALAQQNFKVCVLEAGPEIERAEVVKEFLETPFLDFSAGFPNTTMAPRPDWQKPENNFIQHMGRIKPAIEYLRVLGGTTWHWGGTALRMFPADFKTNFFYGVGVDWPIDYKILEPFYAQAELELGVAGDSVAPGEPLRSTPFPLPPIEPSYVETVLSTQLKDIGLPFISRPSARNSLIYDGRPQCQGHSFCSPICPIGAQYSASVHVEKARRLGVQFLTNMRVDYLKSRLDGSIEYIEATNEFGEKKQFKARAIALAANGIENARLLLMSRSDAFPSGLANHSGTVGRYYMDHPGISCRMVLPDPVYAGRGPESTLISYIFREGVERKNRAAWSLGITNRVRLHDIVQDLLQHNKVPPELDQEIEYRAEREVEIDLQFEQLPDFNNRIELDWEKLDRGGQPSIRMYYDYGAYEQAGFAEGKALILQICKKLNAQRYEISEPGARHHLMGTTRMGINPGASVVDSECKAHDHTNLYILGSSVFPTAGTSNPTLTIAALSLRAAKAIKNQLVNSRL